MLGRFTSARAIATRCRCPPESSLGRCCIRSFSPTRSSASAASPRRSLEPSPAYTSGSSTLCSAVARGSRLKVWNTNPISLLRIRASASSPSSDTRWPLSQYSPAVGLSRQPMRFISVDFPEPDGPMIATNSFFRMVTSTPRRACTTSPPMS